MGDEELAATRVPPRKGHPDGSPQVRTLVQLVSNCITRSAFTITSRIAVLDDEVGNHPVDRQSIEEPLACERHETPRGLRRVEYRQLEFNRTLECLNEHMR